MNSGTLYLRIRTSRIEIRLRMTRFRDLARLAAKAFMILSNALSPIRWTDEPHHCSAGMLKWGWAHRAEWVRTTDSRCLFVNGKCGSPKFDGH